MGPGRILKLDEASISTYLEEVEVITEGALTWRETGPLRQLFIDWDKLNPESILTTLSVASQPRLRKAS